MKFKRTVRLFISHKLTFYHKKKSQLKNNKKQMLTDYVAQKRGENT